jgi:hypothetical protein
VPLKYTKVLRCNKYSETLTFVQILKFGLDRIFYVKKDGMPREKEICQA